MVSVPWELLLLLLLLLPIVFEADDGDSADEF